MAGAACPLFESQTERLSLRLILRRVGQWHLVLDEDLSEITAIDATTTLPICRPCWRRITSRRAHAGCFKEALINAAM
jgi:hypothetical protein